ncbi:MAG: flagellar biosynthesis protein [Candidatus Omnitrophica bacterium]|nr:flagellar biosynthesis protein [Candidatus Omnitrophota bacterium]
MTEMRIVAAALRPLEFAPEQPAAVAAPRQETTAFTEVLREQLRKAGSVNFSRHAMERMQERGMALSEAQLQKLEATVDKVAAKGSRESLMVLDGMAMVVNIPNRTVVTCVGAVPAAERIFTNIDSAVVIDG